MKTILFALLSLNMLFASTTFVMNQNIANTRTSGQYELISMMKVDVLNTIGDMALISIDGEMKEKKARVVKRTNEGNVQKITYKTVISSVTLANMICDEREDVSYELTFTKYISNNESFIAENKLEAVISYTYDWCHSPSNSEVFEYSIQ